MAGGKETPRQKMIGMMYLVLTALLALNVSKEILEAFVIMDKSTNEATSVVNARAIEQYNSLMEVVNSKNPNDAARAEAAKKWVPAADEVRAAAKEVYDLINGAKEIMITKTEGEGWFDAPSSEGGPSNKEVLENGTIIYHTENLSAKDNYDVPMEVMVGPGAELTAPKEDAEGVKLYKKIKESRNRLVIALAKGKLAKSPLTMDDLGGNTINLSDKELRDLLAKKKVNKDAVEKIVEIYSSLSFEERYKVHGQDNIHWAGRLFDHSPIVGAIAQLSSVNQTVHAAEANALSYIRGQVGGSAYSFNKIVPIAYSASNYYNSGDSMEVRVMMAAFDSYNLPKVKYTLDSASGEYVELSEKEIEEGKGVIRMRPTSSGELSGQIAIQKKDGTFESRNWSFPYEVGQPSASIAMPEYLILYQGYDNKVAVNATGFQEKDIKLSVKGATMKKSKDGYIVKPTVRPGQFVTMSVMAAGRSLYSEKYKVMQLPKPEIKFGGKESGSLISAREASSGTVTALIPPPLRMDYKVTSFEITIAGSSGSRNFKGKGFQLPNAAKSILKTAKKGTTIAIKSIRVTSKAGPTLAKPVVFTIR